MKAKGDIDTARQETRGHVCICVGVCLKRPKMSEPGPVLSVEERTVNQIFFFLFCIVQEISD